MYSVWEISVTYIARSGYIRDCNEEDVITLTTVGIATSLHDYIVTRNVVYTYIDVACS